MLQRASGDQPPLHDDVYKWAVSKAQGSPEHPRPALQFSGTRHTQRQAEAVQGHKAGRGVHLNLLPHGFALALKMLTSLGLTVRK